MDPVGERVDQQDRLAVGLGESLQVGRVAARVASGAGRCDRSMKALPGTPVRPGRQPVAIAGEFARVTDGKTAWLRSNHTPRCARRYRLGVTSGETWSGRRPSQTMRQARSVGMYVRELSADGTPTMGTR